jgi:CDI immunity proteins
MMIERFSLEQLENSYWGDPPQDSPRLVKICHNLRKTPINSLSIEDIRLLISQEISLDHIIPLAIRDLEKDMLAAGDFYPGDLLSALLEINKQWWLSNNVLREQFRELIKKKKNELQSPLINQDIKDELKEALEKFLKDFE